MNMWGIILIVIGIILAVAIYNNGLEGVKSNPLESTVDSTKTIYDTGKNVVDYFQGENDTELIEIGMIPCKANDDCNVLDDCNNNCVCYDDGICRR